MAKGQGLTPMQVRFCEHYLACGNGTEAMRRAGSKATDEALAVAASRTLKLAKVQALIQKHAKPASDKRIADADEIKAFWNAMMTDGKADPKDRLKASELLGKVAGMFIEKTKHEGELTITVRRGNDAPGALAPKESDDG